MLPKPSQKWTRGPSTHIWLHSLLCSWFCVTWPLQLWLTDEHRSSSGWTGTPKASSCAGARSCVGKQSRKQSFIAPTIRISLNLEKERTNIISSLEMNFKFFVIYCVVCMFCTYIAHLWMSEDNLQESVLTYTM